MGTIDRNAAATNSAYTNRSGPLRLVVSVETVERDHGPTGYFELLACGHRGEQHWREESAIFQITEGKRRRCPHCGKDES